MTTDSSDGADLFERLKYQSAQQLHLTGELAEMFATVRSRADVLGIAQQDIDAWWRVWRANLDEMVAKFGQPAG